MIETGTRVALNFDVVDTENNPVKANEVGMVIGHMADLEVVELDHLRNYLGDPRVVIWAARAFRSVVVAHPGKPRRTKPRRQET